jgi:transposase
MAPHYLLYVGVDIAAKTFMATWTLDPATAPKPVSFEQTEDGFTAFLQQLGATSVAPNATLVVMEATGSYWIALAIALHQADYVCPYYEEYCWQGTFGRITNYWPCRMTINATRSLSS